MIHFSDDELRRRLSLIVMDERVDPFKVGAIQRLACKCAGGQFRELLADAGLFSNAAIAEAFGVSVSTACKWQTGSIGIPQTIHLLRLLELIVAQRREAA